MLLESSAVFICFFQVSKLRERDVLGGQQRFQAPDPLLHRPIFRFLFRCHGDKGLLVLDALMMAVWRRKPTQEVIVHSDQGSQYGSDDWKRFCDANKLLPSMSRRGNCWDNAVAESFFSSLKKERIRKRIYKTRDIARADIFDYIEAFYNRTRRHSHLGGVSPEAFERASI